MKHERRRSLCLIVLLLLAYYTPPPIKHLSTQADTDIYLMGFSTSHPIQCCITMNDYTPERSPLRPTTVAYNAI